MEFGVKLPNLSPIGGHAAILQIAKRAEALGYESVWVSDHVLFPAGSMDEQAYGEGQFPVARTAQALDPLVTLAFVAGATERVRLGTSVLVLPYRNPIVTAKQWASIDMLSNGRCICGVGSGWMKEEFAALHVSHRDRARITDEWVQIFRACWDEERPSFHGKHYAFDPIHFYPKPAHRIPVWMGGRNPAGLRRVAKWGDGYHGTRLTVADARADIETITRLAEAEGRDPGSIRFTMIAELDLRDAPASEEERGDRDLVGTAEQIAEVIERFEAVGMSHMTLRIRVASGSVRAGVGTAPALEPTLEQVQRFHDEVLPLV